jgi:hypothetical protein
MGRTEDSLGIVEADHRQSLLQKLKSKQCNIK